jgi:hypothetical protein
MRAGLRLTAATALAVVVSGTALGTAAAGDYIPGYTDFPNALRLQKQEKQSEFIPGYTDFPNALRLRDSYAKRAHASVAARVTNDDSGFDWGTAGIGIGASLSALIAAAGVTITVRRRNQLAANS